MRAIVLLRWTLRESRGARGRLVYFAACLAAGVAAVVGAAGLTRTVEGGVRRIRVAYSTAESEANPRLPHIVVDANFGRSVVIVFHTDHPLFDELRGLAESASSFAKGLDEALAAGNVRILSVTKRFIDSGG